MMRESPVRIMETLHSVVVIIGILAAVAIVFGALHRLIYQHHHQMRGGLGQIHSDF